MASYSCSGSGSGGGSRATGPASGQGYSYATLSSSAEVPGPEFLIENRSCKSHTSSGFTRGYGVFSGRPTIDRRYTPPPREKSSRHRSNSGPPSSIFSSIQSSIYSPRNILRKVSLESSKESKVPDMNKKQHHSSLRRSSSPHHEPPRQERRQSKPAPKKVINDKREVQRQSLARVGSQASQPAASLRSTRSSKVCERKKYKGSYGLFGCFGR